MKLLRFNELKKSEDTAVEFKPESMDGLTSVGPLENEDDTVKYFTQNKEVDKDKLSDKS